MAKKQTGKAAVVLVALFAVFTAAMIGLNTVTGPIIESNNAAGEFAPLFAVMSEAKDFEPVYAADGSVAVLAVLAGNDMIVTGDYHVQIPLVIAAVESGEIDEAVIDTAVRRVLNWKYELGLLQPKE